MNEHALIRVEIDGFGVFGCERGLALDRFLSGLRSFSGYCGNYDLSSLPTTLKAGQWPFVSGCTVEFPNGSTSGPFLGTIPIQQLELSRSMHVLKRQIQRQRCRASKRKARASENAETTGGAQRSLMSQLLVGVPELVSPQRAFAGVSEQPRYGAARTNLGSSLRLRLGLRDMRAYTHVSSHRVSEDCGSSSHACLAHRNRVGGWLGKAAAALRTVLAYSVGINLRDGLLVRTVERVNEGQAWFQYEVRDGYGSAVDSGPTSKSAASAVPPAHSENLSDNRVDTVASGAQPMTAGDPYVPSKSSTQLKYSLVTACVPLGLAAVMATVLQQPMFLLFALAGPIIALVQHGMRRQENFALLPAWVSRGLVFSDCFDLAHVLACSSAFTPIENFMPRTSDIEPQDMASFARSLVQDALSSNEDVPTIILPRGHSTIWHDFAWLRPRVLIYDDSPSYSALLSSSELRDAQGAIYSVGMDGSLRRNQRLSENSFTNFQRNKVPAYSDPNAQAVDLRTLLRCASGYLDAVNTENSLPATAAFSDALADSVSIDPHDWNQFTIELGVTESGISRTNLAESGPHMLVAGTTGAGKSEFLQALIFAACARYSAAQLNLILFDYKGGAGLGRADLLPHSVGMVTDLDPQEVSRSLDGIKRELIRREELFKEHNVVNFYQYNQLVEAMNFGSVKEVLPRLLIVVDEFRAITEDHPDFVSRLVRIAAVGRSLGVHLILATQRPAGAITPEIRANVSFRLCLRVADDQDSSDVLGITAAAKISTRFPGRFWARPGNGTPFVGQGLYLDATPANDSSILKVLDKWQCTVPIVEGWLTPVDRDHLLIAESRLHESTAEPTRKLWATALPSSFTSQHTSDVTNCTLQYCAALTSICEHSVESNKTGTAISRPSFLIAAPNSTDLREETWLTQDGQITIIGPSNSGRTTALLACAASRASTEQLTLHWVGAAYEFDDVRQRLESSGNRINNFIDVGNTFLVRALLQALLESRATLQRNVLIIDNIDVLRANLETFDRGSGLALLEELLRSAQQTGVRVAVSSMRPLPPAFQSYFSQRLILASGDSDLDRAHGAPRSLGQMPSIRGRATWLTGKMQVHCQVNAVIVGADGQHPSPSKDSGNGDGHLIIQSLKHYGTESFEGPDYIDHSGCAEGCASVSKFGTNLTAISQCSCIRPKPYLVVGNNSPNTLTITTFGSGLIVAKDKSLWKTVIQGLTPKGTQMWVIDFSIEAAGEEIASITKGVRPKDARAVFLVNLEHPNAQAFQQEIEDLIEACVKRSVIVVGTCTPTGLAHAFRGPLALIREFGTGLLFDPLAGVDRDFLNVPLTAAIDPETFDGKAVLVQAHQARSARIVR